MSSLDALLAAALQITDPAARYRALDQLKNQAMTLLDVERGRAVRDLALAKGPRDMGPVKDRELNWEAAGRELGFSGDWAKRLAEAAAVPTP
jgi:hypothetical protein